MDHLMIDDLIKLDAQMRRPQCFRRAVATRVDFVMAAARYRVTSQLNAVAEASGKGTTLSERSLDCVFEEGDITDAVIFELLQRIATDSQAKADIEDQYGKASIAIWCKAKADALKQIELF
jgi:hypothetical protein